MRTARASLEALTFINRFAGGKPIELNLKEIYAYEVGTTQTVDFEPDFYLGKLALNFKVRILQSNMIFLEVQKCTLILTRIVGKRFEKITNSGGKDV